MNTEEILICLILIAIGYFIAKMFSRCANGVVNGFRVGGKCAECDTIMEEIQDRGSEYYDACITAPLELLNFDHDCSTRLHNMIYNDVPPSTGDYKMMRIVVCLEEGGDLTEVYETSGVSWGSGH